jgi:hypothetical protein
MGVLFAVLDSPCVQLAGTETTRDCSLSMESCMDEKLNELANTYVQNSHSTQQRFHCTNALSLGSTKAQYFIMKENDQLI